jgi:SAM-dependent methyltransferase
VTDDLHYELYPYPPRDPRKESGERISGSPSDLDELVHFCFGGRLDFGRPLRALIAGGGTGDALVMLAEGCKRAGLPAEITYLDVSQASRTIAEGRARARGLSGLTFISGSLLEVGELAPGPYDYIDCCGVLHHMEDPAAGLAALVGVLAPGGGLGLMLYAPYGRTGVYPLQSALRRLVADLPPQDKVAMARRLVEGLPPTNWFARNEILGDHKQSDAGLYDLLLHARDRAFTVAEVETLMAGAGLVVTAFLPPLRYDPALYVAEPRLKARLARLHTEDRPALAEELAGDIKAHAFYAVRMEDAERAVARPDDPQMVPVLRDLDGPAFARSFRPGQAVTASFAGKTHRFPLPPLAGAMLARIDGTRDLGTIHAELAADRSDLDWPAFHRQFATLFATLNGLGKLHLRLRRP